MEIENLLELVKICYQISTTTKSDVFFSYSPHVNYFDLRYFEFGWEMNKECIRIACNEEINKDNLQKAIKKLKELQK